MTVEEGREKTMLQRTFIGEECRVVNIIPPVDVTGGVTSDAFNMKLFDHASILLEIGVSAAAPTSVILEACSAADGTGNVAIPFNVYKQETAAGDVVGDRVAATAAGFVPSANNNIFYVIEVDARELPEDKNWLRMVIANGVNSVIAAAQAILSGPRYSLETVGTAI